MTPSPTDSGEPCCTKAASNIRHQIANFILSDRARLLDELEKAGPKDEPGNIDVGGGFWEGVYMGRNQANKAWRSAIQALRTREGL